MEIQPKTTLLPILPVCVEANGIRHETWALLDSGSEITMLKESIAKRLKLKGPVQKTRISTFHSEDPMLSTKRVSFTVISRDKMNQLEVKDAYTVASPNLTKRPFNLDNTLEDWPHMSGIKVLPNQEKEVSLFIGADHPEVFEAFDTRSDPLKRRSPRGIPTIFGWCIMGALKSGSNHQTVQNPRITLSDEGFKKTVLGFFDMDALGTHPNIKASIGDQEKRAIEILDKGCRYDGERYEVGLLWAEENPKLPKNRQSALQRFNSLERRFARDQEY